MHIKTVNKILNGDNINHPDCRKCINIANGIYITAWAMATFKYRLFITEFVFSVFIVL